MGVTFVTAFYLPSNLIHRKLETYISLFEELAATGIPLVVYLDRRLPEFGERICREYKNIQKCIYVDLNTSFVPKNVSLPKFRNIDKDTVDYLCIQLSKLKHVSDATRFIETSHIAWIDFGIYHMFRDREICRFLLHKIASSTFPTDTILSPGCYTIELIQPFDSVCWNHCGSFLLGAKALFKEAYDVQMSIVAENLPQLTWEVNYWSMMNKYFTTYMANHDELILHNICDYICP